MENENCILYLVLSIKYKELKSQIAKLKSTTQNLKLERQKQNYNLEIQILSPKVF